MRVLLIANTLPPQDLSGVGEQVLQLASGLRTAGHEIRLLGRGGDGAPGPKALFPLAVLPSALRALFRFRPHVVQVHESDGGLAALAVAIAAPLAVPRPLLVALLQVSYREERRAVRPLLWGGRVLGRPGSVERRFRWLKAPLQVVLGCLSAWLADRVLAPSRATAAEIERDYGVSGVEVLPNVTGGLPSPAAALPAGAGEVSDSFLFVGRLRLRKGVEVLLHALADWPAEVAPPRLLIAGDGEQRPALEQAVRDLGLEARVRFLGRCGAGEVRALLERCRALVVPSIYEGLPLVVLEAMAAGCPVVASAVSGIPEVVRDGETGWLVPPEDPPRLRAALLEAWADAALARTRGEAGRALAAKGFRPEVAAERWLAAIRAAGVEESN